LECVQLAYRKKVKGKTKRGTTKDIAGDGRQRSGRGRNQVELQQKRGGLPFGSLPVSGGGKVRRGKISNAELMERGGTATLAGESG